MTNRDLARYVGLPVGGIHERGLKEVFSLFNEIFDKWPIDMGTMAELQPKNKFPRVNVSETDEDYVVDVAVAGFDKDDMSLELKDNCLLIKCDRKDEEDAVDTNKYLLKEISQRSFRRALTFPKKVLTGVDDIKCSYRDGIVTCTLRKEPPEQPKDDTIKITIF